MSLDIASILERLLGNIPPVCDSRIDEERYENLPYYEEATEFLINELIESAKWKNDYRYSANKIGNKAYNFLKRMMDEIEDELRIIDEQEENQC